jgi:hypothetical protein
MFTPLYHPELQPIEKVWAVVKQPVALNPDLEERHTPNYKKAVNCVKRSYRVSTYIRSKEVSP